jgi:hypothetical protein
VDFSHFRPGDWLIVTGGAAMLIFGLVLDWASLGPITEKNAFDYFLTGGIAYLLLVVAALLAFAIAARWLRSTGSNWPVILLVLTGVATALMLVRLILGAGEIELDDGSTLSLDRSSGMYISFLAAVVSFAGAVMNFRHDPQDAHDDVGMSGML